MKTGGFNCHNSNISFNGWRKINVSGKKLNELIGEQGFHLDKVRELVPEAEEAYFSPKLNELPSEYTVYTFWNDKSGNHANLWRELKHSNSAARHRFTNYYCNGIR